MTDGEMGDAAAADSPVSARLGRALAPAGAALLALAFYRRALGFAFFNDDPTGHFAWMEGRSLVGFFTSSAEYGYYRPVVFATLRLFERLFGTAVWSHNPFADHALLLLLHAVNTALVWALARRLGGRAAYAWAAALVFAALPFSYEAVGYVASLTHPLVVVWVLAALLMYDHRPLTADRGQSGATLVGHSRTGQVSTGGGQRSVIGQLAIVLFVTLALLTHENGVFVLPALLGVDWLRRPRDGWRVRLGRLWPAAVPVALYLALWLVIPKNSQQGLNAPGDVLGNAIPFLQTLVFPLLPPAGLGAEDVGLLVALAAGVVALLGWFGWRVGAWRLWLFAVGWVALSAAPALLFLDPAYVYGSPRLSYLPAVGVGLLWGLPVLWVGRVVRPRAGRRVAPYLMAGAAAIYALALVLPAWPFVRCQLDFYDETSRVARAMGQIGHDAPAGRELLFINAPFFFSSYARRPDGCPNDYPWTPVGGILIPPYAQARDFVRFNGGPDRPAAGATFDGYAPGWRTFGPPLPPEALRPGVAERAAYVFDLGRGGFFDLSAAWEPGGAAVTGHDQATFGEVLALTEATAVVNGDALDVALDWHALATPGFRPTVFVHVAGADGVPLAQHDGPPTDGFAPPALWLPGDALHDRWRIDLSALPPGEYVVLVGIYDPATGARLGAESDGQRLPEDVWRLPSIVR